MKKILYSFYEGLSFPVFVSSAVLVGHVFPPLDLPMALLVTATSLFGLFVTNDARLLFAPILQLYFIVSPDHTPGVPTFSSYYSQPLPAACILTVFLSFATSLAVFAVKNRKSRNAPPSRTLLYSLLLLCATFLLNGLHFGENALGNLLFGFFLSLSLLVFYLFFTCFLRYTEKTARYLMKVLVLTGVVITLELCNLYRTSVIIENGSILKSSIFIGWGTWASAGSMTSMLIPPAFYLAAKEKHGSVWFFLGVFVYIGSLLSMARAAFLISTLVFLLSLPLAFTEKATRRRATAGVTVLAGLASFLLFFLGDDILRLVSDTLSLGLGDNGRFAIWQAGIERFLSSPLFGTGFYNSYENDWTFHVFPYFYHNTWIQLLAAGGILCGFLYALHRIESIRITFKNITPTRIALSLSLVSLLLHSLIDVHFFVIYTGFFYSTILALMALDYKKAKNDNHS